MERTTTDMPVRRIGHIFFLPADSSNGQIEKRPRRSATRHLFWHRVAFQLVVIPANDTWLASFFFSSNLSRRYDLHWTEEKNVQATGLGWKINEIRWDRGLLTQRVVMGPGRVKHKKYPVKRLKSPSSCWDRWENLFSWLWWASPLTLIVGLCLPSLFRGEHDCRAPVLGIGKTFHLRRLGSRRVRVSFFTSVPVHRSRSDILGPPWPSITPYGQGFMSAGQTVIRRRNSPFDALVTKALSHSFAAAAAQTANTFYAPKTRKSIVNKETACFLFSFQ